MAQLKTARLSDATIGDQIDNALGTAESDIATILGLATNTEYTASPFQRAIHRIASSVTINNTTTETDIVAALSIVGGTLGDDGFIVADLFCRVTLASGAGTTLTIRLKYGSTTVATITIAWTDNQSDKPFRIRAYLGARGATNAQWGFIELSGDHAQISAHVLRMIHAVNIGEDSTADKNLVITGQWDTADDQFELIYAIIQKVPPT